MSFRTSLFLALRYLRPRWSFTTIPLVLSIVGPILGVAVLITVLSVMNGFEVEMQKRYFEYTAHIVIQPFDQEFDDAEGLLRELRKMGFQASPVIQAPGLVQLHQKHSTKSKMTRHVFIGIDPKQDRTVTSLRAKCRAKTGGKITNYTAAYDHLANGQVICGVDFLKENKLTVGDWLFVHSTGQLEDAIEYEDDGSVHVRGSGDTYTPHKLKIVGKFDFDMSQIDSNLSIVTIDQANKLKGGKKILATEIRVMTSDPFKYRENIARIRANPMFAGTHVLPWHAFNRQWFESLRVTKTLMFVLLVLIILVSAFCVSATLITIVLRKTHEIGVLKAMGAMPATIMTIFFVQGGTVGFLGIGLGTILGFGMLHIRNEFLEQVRRMSNLEFLPQKLYFLDKLPSQVNWPDIVMVNISAFVICVFAGLLPAFMAMLVQPGRAIRAE